DLVAAHDNGLQAGGVLWGYGSHAELDAERPRYLFASPQEGWVWCRARRPRNPVGAAGAATAVTGFRRSYTCNHTFCPGPGTCRASCKSSRLKPLQDRLAQGTQPACPVTVGARMR